MLTSLMIDVDDDVKFLLISLTIVACCCIHVTGLKLHLSSIPPSKTTSTTTNNDASKNFDEDKAAIADHEHLKRFDRSASKTKHSEDPCILTIDGARYNVTAWAKAHPGGVNVLKKFHNKDASRAFQAVGHSNAAYAMLKEFAIKEETVPTMKVSSKNSNSISRWRRKLFTKEDPIGVHKCLGIYCLLHFIFRYGQMYFGDPSAGLGTRLGKGSTVFGALSLVPHGLLSLSSLIFHTVPKERVVGKPMIWQEFRAHNIIFGIRSVLSSLLAWASIYNDNTPTWRLISTIGCGALVLLSMIGADLATKYLRTNNVESTTATMPYWDGCSISTQKKFKSFYAYCQFMATLGCLSCANPAWGLAVLLAIQMASLLMTLVRKGIITTKQYHTVYTTTLIMPWFVGLRATVITKTFEFPVVVMLGYVLYQARRRGVNKYAMWTAVAVGRVAFGEYFFKT